jgi:hypothetical protein
MAPLFGVQRANGEKRCWRDEHAGGGDVPTFRFSVEIPRLAIDKPKAGAAMTCALSSGAWHNESTVEQTLLMP